MDRDGTEAVPYGMDVVPLGQSIALPHKYFKKCMHFNVENPQFLCYFYIQESSMIAILTKSCTITMRCIIASCENICYTNFCKSLI